MASWFWKTDVGRVCLAYAPIVAMGGALGVAVFWLSPRARNHPYALALSLALVVFLYGTWKLNILVARDDAERRVRGFDVLPKDQSRPQR